MSENLKTIRELAEEIGVSKQAIQYHIKSLTNKTRQTKPRQINRQMTNKQTKRQSGISTTI